MPYAKKVTKRSKVTPWYNSTTYKKYSRKNNFEKRVLDIVKRNVETKQAWNNFPMTSFNSFATSSADVIQIVPNIGKGTNDNQRIGDQIHPQSLEFRSIINMIPQDPSQSNTIRRIWCRLLILTVKAFPNYTAAVNNYSTWIGTVLKKGGTTTGFNGDIQDANSPVNTDAMTCHFDSGPMFFGQDLVYNSASASVSTYNIDNMTAFVNTTFKFGSRKKFKYDDSISSGLLPTADGMLALFGYGFCDGTSPESLVSRMQMQFITTLNYEDA